MLGGPLLAYVVLLAGAAVATAALAAYAWRRRAAPGARWLAGLLAGMTFWAGFYAVGLASPPALELRLLWLRLNWVGSGFVPAFWLLFALAFAGRDRWLTRPWVAAACAVPAVTVAIVWSPLADPLVWQDPTARSVGVVSVLEYDSGPWYALFDVWSYAVIGLATVVLGEMVVRQRGLYADQAAALLVGSFMPALGYLVSTLDVLRAGVDVTPLTFPVTGAAFAFVIFRGRLLERLSATPEVGRDVAVETMQDGVVVLDAEGEVIERNPAATDLLAGADDPLAALPVALDGTPGTGTFRTPDGTRHVEATASPIEDVHGRVIGHSVVLRDVTERRGRRQRLAVVNRVLRHNLRNDLTVALAAADRVASLTDDPEVAAAAETVTDVAEELTETGEKARTAERLLGDGVEPGRVAVDAAVADAVDRVRAETGAEVAVDVPSGLAATALPGLDRALGELVTNAVEHGGPPVAITAERTADGIVVRISDGGEGVPDHERAVLGGDETMLEHGSGVGLWTVTWLVERSGGALRFLDDPAGVAVDLRPPPAPGSGPPADGSP
jgi:signal transduction histidine kinase